MNMIWTILGRKNDPGGFLYLSFVVFPTMQIAAVWSNKQFLKDVGGIRK